MIDLDFDRHHIWHPYTSMLNPLPVYPVVRANGVWIELENGQKLIDGMSSWWAAQHGYTHPKLVQAAKQQLEQMSHIMFGGITHQPAVELCRQLIAMTPDSFDCVFLADSGSVSVEVAMKMALQYWAAKGERRSRFLTIEYGYHGDTFGAMSVCDPTRSMHSLYHQFLPQHIFVSAPQSRFDGEWHHEDLYAMQTALAQHHQDVLAVILEPIVQGAGGMRIYHPEYLKGVRALCTQYGIPLILDEIATGFGRTGKMFACEHADIAPDIMCLGKALTGGMMTLSATLCSREIAQTISQSEAGVLMHGPTFMGNPLACAVAVANMAILAEQQWQNQVSKIERVLQECLCRLRDLPEVADVRVLGAIGVVESKRPVDVAKMQAFFVQQGVWIRPFGRLIYLMPPFIIEETELRTLCDVLAQAVQQADFFQNH